jgi:predicted alpha/beta-hydrolase family hydrolase
VPESTLQIEVTPASTITAIRTEAGGKRRDWLFVYAPGAGSNVHDPFGRFACRRLAEHGIEALRFQFLFMEAKRRGPDRPPLLEATWRAVIKALRPKRGRLAVGGRSMGGRIASQVVAQGAAVDALALFAYPLHPPGRPETMRDQHLPDVACPTLFVSGSRDAFASPDELRAAAALVPQSSVHLLDGADHGFAVPKSGGRTRDEVYAEAVDAMLAWLPE